MKTSHFILSLLIMLLISSCGEKKAEEGTLVTERIQYDVFIKSPYPEQDWWIQNLEGSKREWFINMILEKAYSGDIKAYDYLNKPMTAEEVKSIGNRNDTLFMPSVIPPYEDSVVVINEKLKINDITKLRFLEEWKINEKTLQINKRILGLALMLEDYDREGDMRGFKQMFWVYFDDKYPITL